ncbi:MAG: iron-containing alcohol dehydrogenase [Clostridiales bacterium]|nr:iron-containing alcohol dehydrogenase [Clostridiales bacterium]
MNDFVFTYPTAVYFGQGAAAKHLKGILASYGPKVMLAYGGGSIMGNGVYEELTAILSDAGKTVIEFSGIMSNPTYAKVQEGAVLARRESVDLILAVGGGAVVDCCKIVAVQAKTEKDIWEMEFTARKLPAESIPLGAVVTVSGTGAEMNGGAVITHEEKQIKTGVFGAVPRFAILDPAYTMSVPFPQVISGAFDTLSHAMETYFGRSDRDNVSDDVAEAIMRNTIQNMRTLLKNPEDYTARSNLMWDSAMAENGILKVGRLTDFQAHQIEHQLGAYTDCNHGQGLAVILPSYYWHISPAAPEKFAQLAVRVWDISPDGLSTTELADAGIAALAAFIRECGLPTRLRDLRMKDAPEDLITPVRLKEIADSCNIAPNGYKKLTHEEIFEILTECL